MDSTTELSAVNAMLATVGEAPINTLENLDVVDAITALSALQEVTREVLVEGWAFNTDQGFPLSPEGVSPFEVSLPPDALSVVPQETHIVARRGRLYNTTDFSYNFEGSAAIKCEIIWSLDFEELPEVTRQYVALRAARRFQKRAVASELLHAITEEDERRAMWTHRKANIRIRKRRYLVDSQSVRAIHQTR